MPNKEKEFGQLFLIPSSLDQEVLNEFLIEEQKKQLHNLSYFIVEKEKAARKMLKKMNLATKIQELTLFTNTQQTNDSEFNEMLVPIFNGIANVKVVVITLQNVSELQNLRRVWHL